MKMGRRKKNEIKIKVIESKIKVTPIEKDVSLEQQIDQEDKRKFSEFMIDEGKSSLPSESVGSRPEQIENIAETAPQPETQPNGAEPGAIVSPEFSVYKLAETFASHQASTEVRRRYQQMAHSQDAVMSQTVQVANLNETQDLLDRRRQNISLRDLELERDRQANPREEEYEVNIQAEEHKEKRRRSEWI
jgi:hypothetical protein